METIDQQYKMIQGKRKERYYVANQKMFRFTDESGDTFDIVFRVSNDGVGFQFRIPDERPTPVSLQEEKTSYTLPIESKGE